MSLEGFTEKLKEEVQRLSGADSRVEIRMVQKNNMGSIPALNIVEEGNPTAINFYLPALHQEFLKGEKGVAELARELLEIHVRNRTKYQAMDIGKKFQNPETARKLLFFRLIHYGKNRELLEGTPHIRVLDMALVYYLLADRNEEGISSIRVDSNAFHHFGWDAEELFSEVLENTMRLFPERITSLAGLLGEIGDCAEEDVPSEYFPDDCSLTVLTNQSGVNGAAVLVYPGLLHGLAERMGGSLFLLPSSTHEFLAVPNCGDGIAEQRERLDRMVMQVNRECLRAEEVLSDHAYYYDVSSDMLSWPGQSGQMVKLGNLSCVGGGNPA